MSQNIVILNGSTAVDDATASSWVQAAQYAVGYSFAPAWGVDAGLTFIESANAPTFTIPASAWSIYLLDNSDVEGALGYHFIDGSGNPGGRIFVADDIAAGFSPSVTLTHELFEMLADPFADLWSSDPTNPPLFAYEVGDPVEADSNGFEVNGVLISDFVLPSWFDGLGSMSGFDFTGNVSGPGQLASGGYATIFDGSQIRQIFGERVKPNPARFRKRISSKK